MPDQWQDWLNGADGDPFGVGRRPQWSGGKPILHDDEDEDDRQELCNDDERGDR